MGVATFTCEREGNENTGRYMNVYKVFLKRTFDKKEYFFFLI